MAILVVDDEEEMCALLKDAFEHRGYQGQVDVAYTGEQALMMVAERYYDVMILDLVMPGIGGAGVLMRRDEFLNTAVIILTAYGSKETAILALRQDANDYIDKPENGVDGYLEKPIHLNAVVDAVEKLITHYEVDGFQIDMKVRTAYFEGEALDITPEMFNLLVPFIRYPTRTFTYSDLVFMLIGKDMEPDDALQYLKAQMSRLRARLESQAGRVVIRRGQFGPGKHAEFSYFHKTPRAFS